MFKTMNKKLFFYFLIFITCSTNEIEENNVESNNFLCTVDYVNFVNDSNAIVKFETSLGNTTNPFFGRYTYTKEGKDLLIGNELVNIYNFDQKENNSQRLHCTV